jgi:hypothetical protein
MTSLINQALMQLTRRAERASKEHLVNTFVDVGPLFSLLSSRDHQILYGRRGTGKTHALRYLGELKAAEGEVAVYIDLRTIGSAGGIYADQYVPLTERGSRLLIDVLEAIHSALVDYAFSERGEKTASARLLPLLDRMANVISEVQVRGSIEREARTGGVWERTSGETIGVRLSPGDPRLTLGSTQNLRLSKEREARTLEKGIAEHRVHFGAVSRTVGEVVEALGVRRLWILLDEWSSVPIELQPLLADLLRRSIFPIPALTVKIAAIEHRSLFRVDNDTGNYLGIELGADASADLNLDDFLVFNNDDDLSREFFAALLHRHVAWWWSEAVEESDTAPSTSTALLKLAFDHISVFDEFVRAAEGVPRDAMNIIALSAQRADKNQIGIRDLRVASRDWYT